MTTLIFEWYPLVTNKEDIMTFYTYMMRNHLGKDSPAGDLAMDMKRDKDHFPKNRSCKFNGWHQFIRYCLSGQGVCSDCMEVFEECWKEYERCEKKRLNKNL